MFQLLTLKLITPLFRPQFPSLSNKWAWWSSQSWHFMRVDHVPGALHRSPTQRLSVNSLWREILFFLISQLTNHRAVRGPAHKHWAHLGGRFPLLTALSPSLGGELAFESQEVESAPHPGSCVCLQREVCLSVITKYYDPICPNGS